MSEPTVIPQENGPYHVTGDVRIVLSDGTEIVSGETWLCRCGRSATKPLCDGSHGKVGFASDNAEMRDQAG